MIQNLKDLQGHKLIALDGEFGQIKDFYFDDQRWVIRYLVADTGSWLTGRQVLLSPHAFGLIDEDRKRLHLKLTRDRIEKSPSIDAHRPVSRQHEMDYYNYYGWPTYWNGGLMWGVAGFPAVSETAAGGPLHHGHNQRDDLHLRSTKALKGYAFHASDGDVGTVSSFLIDDTNWAIIGIVIETGHWYHGREILVSPDKVKGISYEESKIYTLLTKAEVGSVNEYEEGKALK